MGEHAECRNIAIGFATAQHLTTFVVDTLLSVSSDVLAADNLCIAATATCIDVMAGDELAGRKIRRAEHILKLFRDRAGYMEMSRPAQFVSLDYVNLPKPALECIASWHGISYVGNRPDIMERILEHIVKGCCLAQTVRDTVCYQVNAERATQHGACAPEPDALELAILDMQINLMSSVQKHISRRCVLCLLRMLGVEFRTDDTLAQLRKHLRGFVSSLKKGRRRVASIQDKVNREVGALRVREEVCMSWPQLVSQDKKDEVLKTFREQTCSEALAVFTCFSCAGQYSCSEIHNLPLESKVDLTPLKRPDRRVYHGCVDAADPVWSPLEVNFPQPVDEHLIVLRDVLYHPAGVHASVDGESPPEAS